MAFPPAFLDELSARNPIEEVVSQYVTLKRSGSNLFGLCPFHSEKTGSFSVNPAKNIYYCFGCHKGGGPINFIMEIEGLDFPDAVRRLAQRSGMEVPEDDLHRSTYKKQERLRTLCLDAAKFYRDRLFAPCGEQARAYVIKRGLSPQTAAHFGLGFSPNEWSALLDAMTQKGYSREELLDAGLAVRSQKGGVYDRFRNRLMFPIIDVQGSVIGFGGRVMDDSKPKYLNSPESLIFNKRKNLFALNIARKSQQKRLILTEGYMDAIALHQYGFDCAVASLGTSLTEEHAQILAKYTDEVVLTYDGDEAGQNAAKRAIPMLEKAGLRVRVLRMQDAKDPDEYLKKYGAERFSNLLDAAENQAEYRLQSLKRKYDLSVDEQRVRFLKEAAELISTLSTAVEREIYGHRAAEAAGVSFEAMKLEADKAYKRRRARELKKQENENLRPAEHLQPQIRGLHYDNLRSAMAEEGVLRLLCAEPKLFFGVSLTPEQFSSALLGKAYGALLQQLQNGQPVDAGALSGMLSAEEMSHVTAVLQRQDEPVSDKALHDYIGVITEEYEKTHFKSADLLLAMANRKKETKG